MRCSARSFSSCRSSSASASSSAPSAPRWREPAIGFSVAMPSRVSDTCVSGDAETIWSEPKSANTMYGEGFTARSAR